MAGESAGATLVVMTDELDHGHRATSRLYRIERHRRAKHTLHQRQDLGDRFAQRQGPPVGTIPFGVLRNNGSSSRRRRRARPWLIADEVSRSRSAACPTCPSSSTT